MSFVEHDNIEWTDTMWQVWHIITAKAGAEVWTDAELARACGAGRIDDCEFYESLSVAHVLDAVSALYLSGHIVAAFPGPGWRRA